MGVDEIVIECGGAERGVGRLGEVWSSWEMVWDSWCCWVKFDESGWSWLLDSTLRGGYGFKVNETRDVCFNFVKFI